MHRFPLRCPPAPYRPAAPDRGPLWRCNRRLPQRLSQNCIGAASDRLFAPPPAWWSHHSSPTGRRAHGSKPPFDRSCPGDSPFPSRPLHTGWNPPPNPPGKFRPGTGPSPAPPPTAPGPDSGPTPSPHGRSRPVPIHYPGAGNTGFQKFPAPGAARFPAPAHRGRQPFRCPGGTGASAPPAAGTAGGRPWSPGRTGCPGAPLP